MTCTQTPLNWPNAHPTVWFQTVNECVFCELAAVGWKLTVGLPEMKVRMLANEPWYTMVKRGSRHFQTYCQGDETQVKWNCAILHAAHTSLMVAEHSDRTCFDIHYMCWCFQYENKDRICMWVYLLMRCMEGALTCIGDDCTRVFPLLVWKLIPGWG